MNTLMFSADDVNSRTSCITPTPDTRLNEVINAQVLLVLTSSAEREINIMLIALLGADSFSYSIDIHI